MSQRLQSDCATVDWEELLLSSLSQCNISTSFQSLNKFNVRTVFKNGSWLHTSSFSEIYFIWQYSCFLKILSVWHMEGILFLAHFLQPTTGWDAAMLPRDLTNQFCLQLNIRVCSGFLSLFSSKRSHNVLFQTNTIDKMITSNLQ